MSFSMEDPKFFDIEIVEPKGKLLVIYVECSNSVNVGHAMDAAEESLRSDFESRWPEMDIVFVPKINNATVLDFYFFDDEKLRALGLKRI